MFPVSRVLEEALLRHFTCRKLEIAFAINKPFPFFEALRDRDFISEKMYRESLEACENLVPVSRVAYHVLTELEKTFSPSTLLVLFSPVNLSQYPQLKKTFRSFEKVVASHGGWNSATLVEIAADPAEERPLQTPLSLPPPQRSTAGCPPRVPSEPGASEHHSTETPDQAPSPDAPADELARTSQGESLPRGESPSPTSEEEPRDPPAAPPSLVKAGNSQRKSGTASLYMKEKRGQKRKTPERSVKKRKRCIWSTPKKRNRKKHPTGGATSAEQGTQEKKQVMDQTTQGKDDSAVKSKVRTITQETKTRQTQSAEPEEKRREKYDSRRKCGGTTSSDHEVQEKKQVTSQSRQRRTDSNGESQVMTRAQKARVECTQRLRPKGGARNRT